MSITFAMRARTACRWAAPAGVLLVTAALAAGCASAPTERTTTTQTTTQPAIAYAPSATMVTTTKVQKSYP